MKKHIISIMALLLLCSCINKPTESKIINDFDDHGTIESRNRVESKPQDSYLNKIENEAYQNRIFQETVSNLNFDNTNCIQAFDAFFEKFSMDSTFQKK